RRATQDVARSDPCTRFPLQYCRLRRSATAIQQVPVALSRTRSSWISPIAARCERALASHWHHARRLQSPAERRDRRDVLDECSTGPVEADGRAGIDAFKRGRFFTDIEHLLIAKHGLDVASVANASREAPSAAIDCNRKSQIPAGCGQVGQSRV